MNAVSKPERSAAGRIFHAFRLVAGGKAGAGLISVVYLIISARTLGPADFGALVLVHGYVAIVVGIVEFPSWQAILRYGADAQEAGEPLRLARLLRFSAKLELSAGALACLCALAFAPIAAPLLGWPEPVTELAALYSLAALGSVRSTPAGYLQLIGRFDLIGLHMLVAPIIRLAGAVLAAAGGYGLSGFLIAWLLAALAEFATLWALGLWQARLHLGPDLRQGKGRGVRRENPHIWRFMIASNLDVTLSELSGRAAPLIIGAVMGPAAAGLFSVAQRTTVIISQPAQILGATAFAELSRLVAAGGGGAALRKALAKVIGAAMIICAPLLAIAALAPETIVDLLVGEGWLAAAPLMIWLAAARVAMVAGAPCAAALSALGRPALSLTVNLAANAVFLAILPFALDAFGLAGAGAQALAQAVCASAVIAYLTLGASRKSEERCVSPMS